VCVDELAYSDLAAVLDLHWQELTLGDFFDISHCLVVFLTKEARTFASVVGRDGCAELGLES
jgi:hypothetical protein